MLQPIPSGNLTACYGRWPIQFDDVPFKMAIFHSYVITDSFSVSAGTAAAVPYCPAV